MVLAINDEPSLGGISSSDPACSDPQVDAFLTGLFQAPEGSSPGHQDLTYCADCRTGMLLAAFFAMNASYPRILLNPDGALGLQETKFLL